MSDENCISEKWITIGIIRKPIGLKGACAVECLGTSLERFMLPLNVFIGDAKQPTEKITLESIVFQPKGPACHFTGIDSIEQVEPYRNKYIYITEDQLPELDEGRFYHFDLIGLKVWSDSGKEIGFIKSVHNFPSVECIEVERHSLKSIMIPLISDAVISIDQKSGYCIVRGSFIEELF